MEWGGVGKIEAIGGKRDAGKEEKKKRQKIPTII